MNLSLDKRPDRIFVLTCGRSCDSVDFLPFLKNEYVIAVSRWAFLFKEHPFDFYYVNDHHRLIPMTIQYGGFDTYKDFMASDLVTWNKNYKKDEKAFVKYDIKRGKYTYTTRPWASKSLFDADFLNENGVMPTERPQDYFKDEHFKKYPVQYTGYGSATRVAVDLAYFLKFKTCYIMALDAVSVQGGWYSRHITDIAAPQSSTQPTVAYSRNSTFSTHVWRGRYSLYKGFDVRRVVPKDMYDIERKEVDNPQRRVFKTVFYEDVVNDSPAIIDEIKYHDWVT